MNVELGAKDDTVEENWLSRRVWGLSYEKLLYNESIKSLSLIRNSTRVRASEWKRGGWVSPPGLLPSALFLSLTFSPLQSRFPSAQLPELPAHEFPFVLRASRNGSSLKSPARGRTKAGEKYARWEETDGAQAERYGEDPSPGNSNQFPTQHEGTFVDFLQQNASLQLRKVEGAKQRNCQKINKI